MDIFFGSTGYVYIFFDTEGTHAVMLTKYANEVPRAAIMQKPNNINMDVSFKVIRGTGSSGESRLKANCLVRMQKKDIHIPIHMLTPKSGLPH
jgi:hypothetical protein